MQFFLDKWNDFDFNAEGAYQGVVVFVGTLVLTLVLELLSLDTVRKVFKQPNGKSLYMQGIMMNFFNHITLGIPLYALQTSTICTRETVEDPVELTIQVVWIMAWQSYQFYAYHKAFHEYPALYQRFHRFHHRFHTHVPPSAANAVTAGEYFFAYMIPFLPPALTRTVSCQALFIAVSISSVLNLLVHMPKLEEASKGLVPSIWVSTNNHLDHHRKLSCHYASPSFNVDTIVDSLLSLMGPSEKQEESKVQE